MQNTQNRQEENDLFLKFFYGTLSAEDQVVLEECLKNSEEDRQLFNQLYVSFQATRTLALDESSHRTIALENLSEKIGRSNRFLRYKKVFFKIAAILIFPLISLSAYLLLRDFLHQPEPGLNVVSGINKQASLIKFQDGSEVYLHTGSTLRYPDHFVSGERHVELEGEAYFEVYSDPENPFFVHTIDGSVIEVTGTRFNVSAYEKDQSLVLYLREGKIRFHTPDNEQVLPIEPGTQLVYNKKEKTFTREYGNGKESMSWMDGKLIFNDTPIDEVARRLSNHLGVTIRIQDTRLNNHYFKATFRDESLQQILGMLRVSTPGLSWTITEGKEEDGKDQTVVDLFLKDSSKK